VVTPNTCVECGDELPGERVELGYAYCTKAECQAVRHRGLTITTFGVNKSADSFVIADADEVRRRGEAGGFGRKDNALGLDYRQPEPAAPPRSASRKPTPAPTPARARRAERARWTPEQQKVVRLYHDMGLNPRQIVERARQNAPRLGITERLAVQILSATPRR
jgi:hypothetical protein